MYYLQQWCTLSQPMTECHAEHVKHEENKIAAVIGSHSN